MCVLSQVLFVYNMEEVKEEEEVEEKEVEEEEEEEEEERLIGSKQWQER